MLSFLLGMRYLVLRVFLGGEEGHASRVFHFRRYLSISYQEKRKNYRSYVSSYLPIPTDLGSTWILDPL